MKSGLGKVVLFGYFAFALVAQSASAQVSPVFQIQSKLSVPLTKVETGNFTQTLDHSNSSDLRTFKQRFAVFTDHAPVDWSQSPVIYYICGEASCFGSNGDTSSAVPSAIDYYANNLHAVIVLLEHRFYGKSQPFTTLTTDHLKYLSVEQALEDLAEFQKYAIQHYGFHGKWIVAGGSYAGALSAYYREKHPELAVGSLSSSGVVKASLNFEDYDRVAASALKPDCLNAVQEVTHEIEQALSDPTKLAAIEKTFGSEEIQSNLDFLSVVDTMISAAVQYGQQDMFCDSLLGGKDHLTGFAQGGIAVLKLLGQTPLDGTTQTMQSIQATDYEDGVGWRQWVYQTCTEFGDFATPYHDPKLSVQSTLLNLDYFLDQCKTLFGITSSPEVDRLNSTYYQPILEPVTTGIFFVNGSDDPYSTLSVTHENGNDTNPNTLATTIQGGSHCSDLEFSPGESTALKTMQNHFLAVAKQWLIR
jgi:pimeloyl-ACP methyl ester carboxylesterase